MNNFFCNYKTQKANQEHTVSDIDLNMNNFFCDHTTHPVDPEHVFSEIDLNYRRDYSKGKSFRVSIWNNVDTYNNDDFIQDFVVYDRTLWARIDSTPSTNEIPSEGPWAKIIEGVSDIEFEERDGKVYWKYEDEAEWKLLFSGVSSDYVKKEELVKINGQKIYNGEDITIEMNEGESDDISISKDIPVTGGPLSQFLIDAGIKTIEKGMNLQDLFVSLFCKEEWPKTQSVKGTIAPSTSMTVSVYPDKTGLVLPGTQIKFTAERSDLPAPSTTNSTVKGFTYGYSESKEGADKTGKNIEERWSVTKTSSNYTMLLSCGNSQKSSTNKTDSITIQAQVGENTCTANASGTVKYSASIDEIPSYYIISSLGNKDDEHKSDSVFADSKSVTCSALNTAQSTVTCAYPCFHNNTSSGLSDTEMVEVVQEEKVFEIKDIPSEKSSNKPFIFEFPADRNVSIQSKPNLLKYKYYTNISGNTLVENVSNNGQNISSNTIEIVVPQEKTCHFKLQFPAIANISVTKLDQNTKQWNSFTNYKTSDVFKRENNDYLQFEVTGKLLGSGTYKFTFTVSDYRNTNDGNVTNIKKIISGTQYEYKRFTTNKTAEFVSRKITLSKAPIE